MKRLKKGFTLIELLVVIAIIGILATTLAPKLREQLAKAKDAKAIAVLGAGRTVVSALVVDRMVQATTSTIGAIDIADIRPRLDSKANDVFTTSTSALLVVGGTRTDADDTSLTYGGNVTLTIGTPADDEVKVTLEAVTTATEDFSTEGKAWNEY